MISQKNRGRENRNKTNKGSIFNYWIRKWVNVRKKRILNRKTALMWLSSGSVQIVSDRPSLREGSLLHGRRPQFQKTVGTEICGTSIHLYTYSCSVERIPHNLGRHFSALSRHRFCRLRKPNEKAPQETRDEKDKWK